jgi:predicted ATPase
VLVVLDNCEHLLDACAALAGQFTNRPAARTRLVRSIRRWSAIPVDTVDVL